jgi:SAM-dependent methyltransferase
MRVLEIGCGPGAAAREIAARVAPGYVLGIDRSPKAIQQARIACAQVLSAKHMGLRCIAIEDFELLDDEAPYDLALAVRVGVLDGRHPDKHGRALERIRTALTKRGSLWVGDGADMQKLSL